MKENIDIEKLFQDKFENFEGNVNPSVWTNVSQSINTGAAGSSAATGMSLISKVAIITASVAVTSVGVWYLTNTENNNDDYLGENTIQVEEENNNNIVQNVVTIGEEDIKVSDTNDPVIQEHIEELQEEFNPIELPIQNLDEELVDILLENNSNNQSNDENTEVVNNNSSSSDNEDDKEETTQVDNGVKPIVTNLQFEVDGNTLVFDAGAENHYSVEWEFGDGNTDYSEKGEHEYTRPGTYSAKMIVNGEEGTKFYPFKVVIEGTSSISMIPNVFTPDNDGYNDYFFIESEGLEEFLIVIYDLDTQEEVYRSEDPDFRWDGERYDGSVKQGRYIFKIIAEGEDGAIFKEAKQLHITEK